MNLRARRAAPWLAALSAVLVVLVHAGRAQTTRPSTAPASGRIVAIGDVHGAYDEFVSILSRAGLIDTQQRWAGGRTIFVQTGDFTDRGAGTKQVMDLLMAVEQSVRGSGGQVISLLGNHEVMNIIGDFRYVTPEIVQPFADARSDERREQAWKQYESLAAARAKARVTLGGVYRQTREAWMQAHPPGWLEYREALGPRGRYGRWLRGKQVAALVDGTIFMHAGISPDQPATIDEVNKTARADMARYETFLQRLVDAKLALPFFTLQEVLAVSASELQAIGAVIEAAKAEGTPPDLSGFQLSVLREAIDVTKIDGWSILAGEGPLWFRGYALWPEDETSAAKVHAFLDKFGVKRIVVGHTPLKSARITPRFGGRVLLIDTGMLVSAYNGRPSALEIKGAQLTAIYEDGSVPLSVSSTPEIAAAR